MKKKGRRRRMKKRKVEETVVEEAGKMCREAAGKYLDKLTAFHEVDVWLIVDMIGDSGTFRTVCLGRGDLEFRLMLAFAEKQDAMAYIQNEIPGEEEYTAVELSLAATTCLAISAEGMVNIALDRVNDEEDCTVIDVVRLKTMQDAGRSL